jgi:small-conductance mechanosensitive channel
LLLPLSGLTSWLIVLAGGLSLLQVLGINVAPLLTVGGVSGILVGLSAQSVMVNMIAGINLVFQP